MSAPKAGARPSTNPDFWNRKLDGNLARDAANQGKLAKLDWTVFVIWECSLDEGTATLLAYLRQQRDTNSACIEFGTSPEEIAR